MPYFLVVYFNLHLFLWSTITYGQFDPGKQNSTLVTPVIKIIQERQVSCLGDDDPLPFELGDGNSCEDEDEKCVLDTQSVNLNSGPCFKLVDRNYSNETENTVLGQRGDRLRLTCEAPYLTFWNSTIIPTKDAIYKESRRYDQNPLQLDNLTFINAFELIIEAGTSGWIRCKSIGNSAAAPVAEIFVFAQDGSELVTFGYDAEGAVLLENISGKLNIPCIANYPHVKATLEQETELFQYKPVNPSRIVGPYDPRKGFIVQGTNASDQTYRCVPSDYNYVLVYYKKLSSHRHASTGSELKLFTGSLTDGKGDDTEKQLDIFCSLNGITKIMFLKMIRCTSPRECDWLRACFDKCWLNHYVEKQEISVTLASGALKNPYPTGLAVCILPEENLSIYNYYFIGLDRLSYFKSDPYPTHAVIRVETVEEHFYTYQSTKFRCTISTFLLVSNIKFVAMFKNKPPLLLDRILPEGDRSLLEYEYLGFSQKDIAVNLTKEMTGLVCMAPKYNSKDWINVSIAFDAKDPVLPTIEQSNSSVHITFRHGESNQVLHCSAKGDPKPEISWIFPSESMEALIKFTKTLEGESTLPFPKVRNEFAGKYTCIAKNRFGNKSVDFIVDIDDGSLGSMSVLILCLAGFVFCMLIGVLVYFLIKYQITKDSMRNLTEDEIQYFTLGRPGSGVVAGPEMAKCMGFDRNYIISDKDLIIAQSSLLGQGEFGMVYRGFLHGEAVAVKTTKSNTDVAYVKALLAELKIQAYIGEHPHVVGFKGAVVSRIKERIVYSVIELSPVGNLHSYLRKLDEDFLYSPNGEGNNIYMSMATRKVSKTHPRAISNSLRFSQVNCLEPVTTKSLTYWCMQIADGMEYLAEKKVIHGDLAARNILVFKHDIMKITDFGLSRQLYGYTQYVKKQQAPLPWRWLAIEALRYFEFSTESDVWSFGVTLWEIFSMGETPYPGQTWSLDFHEKLSNGLRLKKPKNTPANIYDTMQLCWSTNPADRPKFSVLKNYYKSLVRNHDKNNT